jgi:hypothetical protein
VTGAGNKARVYFPARVYLEGRQIPDVDASALKKIVVLILSIIFAYFLANIVTSALLRIVRLSGAAESVAGLILFGILFFSILQGIEKLTGTGIFRFGP